jgi:hypothetical protein
MTSLHLFCFNNGPWLLLILSLVTLIGLCWGLITCFCDSFAYGLRGLSLATLGIIGIVYTVNADTPSQMYFDPVTESIIYKINSVKVDYTPTFPSIEDALEYYQNLNIPEAKAVCRTRTQIGKYSYDRILNIAWKANTFTLTSPNSSLTLTTTLTPKPVSPANSQNTLIELPTKR